MSTVTSPPMTPHRSAHDLRLMIGRVHIAPIATPAKAVVNTPSAPSAKSAEVTAGARTAGATSPRIPSTAVARNATRSLASRTLDTLPAVTTVTLDWMGSSLFDTTTANQIAMNRVVTATPPYVGIRLPVVPLSTALTPRKTR